MKSATLIKIKLLLLLLLILSLIVFLVAPFTFLKPKAIEKPVEKPTIKIAEKKPPKVIVKKVLEKPLHDVVLPDFAAIREAKRKSFLILCGLLLLGKIMNYLLPESN
jgi:Bax protein